MFDFHMHSRVSFDGQDTGRNMALAARNGGLREICFTDHYDFNDVYKDKRDLFTIEQYRTAYDSIVSPKVKIRRGVEFGLTHWNRKELQDLLPFYQWH